MVVQEIYMICHFALVIASPHLTVGTPVIAIIVAVGLLIGLTVIVALFVSIVARQFDPPALSTQTAGHPPLSHFTPQITRCGRGTPMPRAPTRQTPVA
jgi:hypothetical protein